MNANMYAGRKRRKPAQRGVKPVPTEGTKTNPSKRHRDRLNSELDRLASLLPFPEEVISSLDKLSILRLSVSYLRTKSFFSEALKHQPPNGISKNSDGDGGGMTPGAAEGGISEGELLLQALNGFVLVVTSEGNIFFCSHTIQDYLGFHQTDVMHQSVFELIHTEDQQEFKRNLHWALNPPVSLEPPTDPAGEELTSSCPVSYNPDQLPPENSSFLERAFVCRFRCLLDNSSGFLPLSIQGRLKFLHGQSRQSGSSPPQLALFAVATPLQPPAILEIRTKNMIFRTKHKLDFTPMACDAKGKIVLGYTEAELRVRGSGYQFIHAADMLYCAENHIRMIKTGESGLTVFRLLTKDNRWKWVQANARLVYKNGKPDYIIATQRPLAEEEGGEHLRKRSMHLPFTFATGEALLYQTSHPLHGFPDSSHGKARGSKSNKGKVDKSSSDELKPNSLLGALMSQDESVYVCQPDAESRTLYHGSRPAESDSLLSTTNWNIVSSREMGTCNGDSLDPLLSTLDSLSLDGGETCSNSELFSALESLGLNADDLELLLLDERMMQVELDPNHVPTLTDLLTNNEILTYVHDTLQSEMENEVPSSDPDSAPQQPCLIPEVPLDPPTFRQPIVQLSQQMQQHIQAASHPAVVENPAGLSDSLWVDHHLQTTLSGPQLDAEHLNPHLESPWQLQINPENTASSSFLNGSYQNQNMTFPLSLDVSLPDYTLDSCTTLLNGEATLDVHQHQGGMTTAATPAHLGQQKQNPASCLSHGTAHVEQQRRSLNCSVFGPAADRKVENGCLLNVANVGYVRTCLIPGRNGVEAVTGPDEVSNLQDPQKSGFFL
ncbi:aryl hydrocarbon receptor-like [Poecilia reticulata]|uniref:aryl hydrocarbon receptor-like n=1 Tax=Poecilia reticulata TaxID=8081 RepID=UPI0004A25F70|nr:PREDICTED: aryl hydrocarbon receptor-like [Poecilia reticulata]